MKIANLLCVAFHLGWVGLLPVTAADAPTSYSWQAVTGLVARVYAEELHRAPDAGGLRQHAELMVAQGRNEAWLRAVLRNSVEAQNARLSQRAHRVHVALAVCGLLALLLAGYKVWAQRAQLRSRFPAHTAYLETAVQLTPLCALLMMFYAFDHLKNTGPDGWILTGILVVAIVHLLGLPRWFTYAVVASGLLCFFSYHVFVDAQGPQDAFSDRNEAVENAARSMLQGTNPWSARSVLGLPITTGPSSIMLAVPVVKVTGRINLLTFCFWALFLGLLLIGDVLCRNGSFVLLGLLVLLPWTGVLHTLHWSLDELYYAVILLPVLWFLLERRWLVWAGVLMGFMCFSRLVYVFGLIGVGLWWLSRRSDNWKQAWRLVLGALLYMVPVLALFYGLGGHDFVMANFWKNSQPSHKEPKRVNGASICWPFCWAVMGVV
jgi:hypothetical protein